jgi:hypothetical protein
MRNIPYVCLLAMAILFAAISPARSSDHADPMSLDVLKLQSDQEANITDLHAFVVDPKGYVITQSERLGEADRLILSLCVRRALQPAQIEGLNLAGYKFRIHIDFDAQVRFVPAKGSPEWEKYNNDYNQKKDQLIEEVNKKTAALEEAKKSGDANRIELAQKERDAAVKIRAALIEAHETDDSMQALYGGIIMQPDGIADDAILEFEVGLHKNGENSQTFIAREPRITGIPGKIHIVEPGKEAEMRNFPPETIHVETNVFDDPFIFPRFFRRNVVGIVASIPLTALPARRSPMLLWATTHGKDQIDHVGRSLRTQLPRFGYLNPYPPRDHVKEITRVHDFPTVMEDILATFLAPLVAHRHYDSAPDVIVYDLTKPPKFPNGRALSDDVAAALADAGETLLLELAYAESKQFPRATTNDKPFPREFPYLAPRWTAREIAAHATPGTTMRNVAPPPEATAPSPAAPPAKDFVVPRAPDPSAIAAPNLKISTWRTLWRIEIFAILVLSLLLILSVRTWGARGVIVILAVLGIWFLRSVYADPLPAGTKPAMEQPQAKLLRLIGGGAFIFALLVALAFNWGRRSCLVWPVLKFPYPKGRQGITSNDLEQSSFEEIENAVFNPDRNQPYYKTWRGPGEPSLPVYKQTFTSITRGLLVRFWKDFAMLSAAKRTLRSRGDLRWGPDGKGFHRLVHAMGICLKGKWEIDPDWAGASYTGYFAPGAVGRVIARYSLGGNDPRNGRYRSLGLVGKLFPEQDYPQGVTPRAHFITQEDLGGAFTNSVVEVDLTNSPPVTLLKRGYGVFSFLAVIVALLRADKEPSERQLYEIAELEKPPGVPTSCPRFMRLRLIGASPAPQPNELDFRDEILGLMYGWDTSQKRNDLVFSIEVSDAGRRTWLQRVKDQEWLRIGTLTFDQAVVSYNGDFVIHFHHPPWRKDRNDRKSVARRELRHSS